ncbi:hypothetical protein F7R91_07830 [Streptomyces luteolifulvus]|uniref:Molybdopterin oxidoreductase n=1 Tax=Streptomyces luteolifulvus TaxID=2615112 RepID=A0A6H9V6C9_9ACTN|nr:hypothetical protein [Streptomyces luteolifulvus]KAB1148691.1 hypothetical protein F7R91_07830 [Streptomyces luteolifulvus]
MNGVPIVLRALYDGERELERQFLAAADRHCGEHEFHHVAKDMARWSHEHSERIAHAAAPHDLHLPGPMDRPEPGPPAILRETPGRSVGRQPPPGLHLLRDLRDLHLAATENSLNWEMLAEVAQAAGDTGLLDLAADCHPQTLRQLRWTNTMIKTLSPQLLTSL